jgi:hypothetical protein
LQTVEREIENTEELKEPEVEVEFNGGGSGIAKRKIGKRSGRYVMPYRNWLCSISAVRWKKPCKGQFRGLCITIWNRGRSQGIRISVQRLQISDRLASEFRKSVMPK